MIVHCLHHIVKNLHVIPFSQFLHPFGFESILIVVYHLPFDIFIRARLLQFLANSRTFWKTFHGLSLNHLFEHKFVSILIVARLKESLGDAHHLDRISVESVNYGLAIISLILSLDKLLGFGYGSSILGMKDDATESRFIPYILLLVSLEVSFLASLVLLSFVPHIFLGHLSVHNNTQELAYRTVKEKLLAANIEPRRDCMIYMTRRYEPSRLLEF